MYSSDDGYNLPFATFCEDTDVGYGGGVIYVFGYSIALLTCFNEENTVCKKVPLGCILIAHWEPTSGPIFFEGGGSLDFDAKGVAKPVRPKCLQVQGGMLNFLIYLNQHFLTFMPIQC